MDEKSRTGGFDQRFLRSNCASKHSTIVLVESTAAVRCTGVVSTYMITPCSVSLRKLAE